VRTLALWPVSTIPSADTARAELVALLDRVARGERAAMRGVYDRTSAKLFGIALRICGEREAAEDVLQDIYLKIWRRAGRFDASRASPITWLATIARNTAIDWRRAHNGPAMVGDDALATVADDRVGADVMVEDAETRARIFTCIGALEERRATAIRAAFFDGLSYPQLAERMAVPLSTMKSWIRRGLIELRACLGHG
jgi:RNA polymerase sigma factor (sigma-70 family)